MAHSCVLLVASMFAYFFLRTAVQLFPQIQCLAFATMVSLRATLMNISYRLISISIIRIEYTDINSIHTYTSMYIYIHIQCVYVYRYAKYIYQTFTESQRK